MKSVHAAQDGRRPAVGEPVAVPRARLRVLFVDDDPSDIELEMAALRRDFEVEAVCADGIEAFGRLLREGEGDVILCDYSMPGFSGLDALAHWQAAGASMPFIFVTGRLSEEVAVDCMKAGATDYVLKGNLTRLPMAVHRALRERSAAHALRQAERERARVVAAIEQTEEAVLITDPRGVIVYVNPAFSRITGYEANEALGRTPRILRSGEQDAAFYAELWHRIGAGAVWYGQLINRRRDGSLYDAEVTIAPVFDDSGRIANFCAIQRDVSARVAAERNLRDLYAKLAETDRLKDEFLAAFSHELRTPLNIILGYADLLTDAGGGPPLDAESRHFMDGIIRSASHLTSLINETLDLARLRIDAVKPQLADVDAVGLVGEVVDAFLPHATGKGLTLRYTAPASALPLRTDPLRLRQILTNLIDNAVKFTEHGGIEVRLNAGNSHLSVEVHDTGIGVAPADVPRMFEDFRQLDGSSTRRYGGCGLGLALAKRLTDLLGGTIAVESQVGSGTCFRVELPQTAATESLPRAS